MKYIKTGGEIVLLNFGMVLLILSIELSFSFNSV